MLMEVLAMIKLGSSFVNVLLVMMEQTVKMVSKNITSTNRLISCVDSVWEISASKLSNVTKEGLTPLLSNGLGRQR